MVAVTSHPDPRDDPRNDPHDHDQSGDWDEPIDPTRSVEHTFPGPTLTPPLNRFTPPKAKPFEPSPDLEPHIFQKLANPDCSLTYLAKELDTTVDALSLWMARPDIMEKCRTIVSAGMMQTKMVVSTRLNMCVKGLMTIVACGVNVDSNTPMPISYHDRKLREYQRHNVIRAIALVLRCGRFDPFAPTRAPRPHNNSPDNTRPPSGFIASPRINETLDGKPPNWTAYHAAIRQHDADVAATKHTPQPIESAHAAHAAVARNNASTTDAEPASTTEPAPDALTTRVPPVPDSDAQRPEPELVPVSDTPAPDADPALDSASSTPLRRTDRCHDVGGECVVSGPSHTSSSCSSPPPGRTNDNTGASASAASPPSSSPSAPSSPAHSPSPSPSSASSSPRSSAALRVESSPALSPRSLLHASIRPRSRDSPPP